MAGVIGSNSADYNQTIEYVTNNMLVTNILRARDEVPLHFSDLSQIHGVIQLNVSAQAQVPFGDANIANQRTRNIFTGLASVSSSPTFDVVPLNNTIFSTGLLRPLDVAVLQNYLEQGTSQALLLKLLVSKIEFLASEPHFAICSYENTPFINPVRPGPADAADPCPPARLDRNIHTFADIVDGMTLPTIVHTYQRLRPYGPPFAIEQRNEVRNLSSAGASTMVMRAVRGRPGEYQFFKSSTETAICLPLLSNVFRDGAPGYVTASDMPSTGCYEPEVVQGEEPPRDVRMHIYMRSMQGIFEYLGGVLRVEQLNQRRTAAGQDPLPLPKGLNFFVPDGEDLQSRLNLSYNGGQYHVNDPSGRDNTLRVLQVVNQLLDTLKNASEIPTTRSVDVLP